MRLYKRRRAHISGLIPTAAVFLLALLLFFAAVSSASDHAYRGGAQLKQAIVRATATCYAIEGRYPPNLQYIVDNYGVYIDPGRYTVVYDSFAQNLMPEITVVERGDRP